MKQYPPSITDELTNTADNICFMTFNAGHLLFFKQFNLFIVIRILIICYKIKIKLCFLISSLTVFMLDFLPYLPPLRCHLFNFLFIIVYVYTW